MLGRLEVGLVDEGVRVVRAQPADIAPMARSALGEQVFYDASGFISALVGLGRLRQGPHSIDARLESRRLIAQIEELNMPPADRLIDVVHVWGEECWTLALSVAASIGAGCALEVWRADLAPRLRRYERRFQRSEESAPMVWMCPNELIRMKVERSSAQAPCRLAPWGVFTPAEPLAWGSSRGDVVSIAVLATGDDQDSLAMALEGLAHAAPDPDKAIILLDSGAVRKGHRAWKAAEEFGLLDRLTLIPDMEARRELVLRADVLIQPEPSLGARSIILDAMAAGMTIVSRRDEDLEELIDGETASLVRTPTASAWESAISAVLRDRELAARLSENARAHTRANRSASGQVSAAIDAYNWLLGSDAIAFSG